MRIKLLIHTLGLIAVLQSVAVHAQDVTANAMPDTNVIRLGEQINYTVKVSGMGDFEAKFPEIKDTLAAGVEVVGSKEAEKEKDGNITTITKAYRITGFEPDGYAIPPLKIQIRQNGSRHTIKSNSSFLQINSVPIDTTKKDIYDVKAPLNAPMTVKEFLVRFYPYIIGVILLALVLWYVLVYRKRRKPAVTGAVRKPLEPAHIEALNALEALDNKMLWQKDKIKAYYTELTDILRHYIYRRFGTPTMERTSSEILFALRNRNAIQKEYYEQLHYILETADFVKFARGKTTPDENEQCMQNARNFVRATEPRPEGEGNSETDDGDKNQKE